MRSELLQGGAPQLPENAVHFAGDNADGVTCPFLATGGQAIERCRADHHRVGTQGDCLYHVCAAPEPAINDYGESVANRSCNFGQYVDR